MAACQFIYSRRWRLSQVLSQIKMHKRHAQTKCKQSDQAKKMGWKNPPMQLSRETRIVLRKCATGNTFNCQAHRCRGAYTNENGACNPIRHAAGRCRYFTSCGEVRGGRQPACQNSRLTPILVW